MQEGASLLARDTRSSMRVRREAGKGTERNTLKFQSTYRFIEVLCRPLISLKLVNG